MGNICYAEEQVRQEQVIGNFVVEQIDNRNEFYCERCNEIQIEWKLKDLQFRGPSHRHYFQEEKNRVNIFRLWKNPPPAVLSNDLLLTYTSSSIQLAISQIRFDPENPDLITLLMIGSGITIVKTQPQKKFHKEFLLVERSPGQRETSHSKKMKLTSKLIDLNLNEISQMLQGLNQESEYYYKVIDECLQELKWIFPEWLYDLEYAKFVQLIIRKLLKEVQKQYGDLEIFQQQLSDEQEDETASTGFDELLEESEKLGLSDLLGQTQDKLTMLMALYISESISNKLVPQPSSQSQSYSRPDQINEQFLIIQKSISKIQVRNEIINLSNNIAMKYKRVLFRYHQELKEIQIRIARRDFIQENRVKQNKVPSDSQYYQTYEKIFKPLKNCLTHQQYVAFINLYSLSIDKKIYIILYLYSYNIFICLQERNPKSTYLSIAYNSNYYNLCSLSASQKELSFIVTKYICARRISNK